MIQGCFDDNGKFDHKPKVQVISGYDTVHGQACAIWQNKLAFQEQHPVCNKCFHKVSFILIAVNPK